MFRTLLRFTRTALLTAGAAAMCTAVLTGCGKAEDTSAAPAGPPPSDTHMAASGPALAEKLSFNQLALESTPKVVKSKAGPVYVEFLYQGLDGNVYKCSLPKALTEGQYEHDEWVNIFEPYKLPEVVKHGSLAKKAPGSQIGDFPFIAPRPAQQQAEPTAQPSQPATGRSTIAPPTPQPMPGTASTPATGTGSLHDYD